MVQVHKFIVSVVDLDEVGAEEAASMIENASYPNDAIGPKVESIESAEIGEWDDDHPLNGVDAADAFFAIFGMKRVEGESDGKGHQKEVD